MRAHIERATAIERSVRVVQLRGMFDLTDETPQPLTWDVELPLDEQPWNIGLIVGPSGTGKSTILREFWRDELSDTFDWPADRSVLDGFPADMSTKEVVDLLSSVGFSSPPSWLRPFRVLSNGEQFRASIARLLAERRAVSVVDEFTSVVDRTVAQIGSCAIAKTVRAREQQFIAATCHYDVEDWLQPDWTYQPHVGVFSWRSVQSRPRITLNVVRSDRSAWRLFGPHHYLSDKLNRSSVIFVASWDDHPCVMLAVLPFPHPKYRAGYRVHRLVTLPDYQGVGLGNRFCDFMAGVYRAAGRDLFLTTSHPAAVRSMSRNELWRMTRQPSFTSGRGDSGRGKLMRRASERLTAGFHYVGPAVESPLVAELTRSTRKRSSQHVPTPLP